MIEKLNKILNKLDRHLPGCQVQYGPNPKNTNVVDFFIYYDRRKKYIKISIIKAKIDKINIRLLIKDIKNIINKQYYGLESNIIVFDNITGNHVPRLD